MWSSLRLHRHWGKRQHAIEREGGEGGEVGFLWEGAGSMRRVLSPLGLAAGTPPPPPPTPRASRHRRPLSQSRDLTTHKRVQKRLLQPSWSQANGTERPVARVRALVHREFARLREGLAAAVNPSWSQVYGCLWQHTGQSRRLETPPHAHPLLPLVLRRTSVSTSDRMRSHSSPCPPQKC